MNCNRRARTTAERIMCQYEAHLGPVHALHRHPQLPKIFLTVGDWTTHVWTEDIRDSPILTLKWVPCLDHAISQRNFCHNLPFKCIRRK